MTFNLSCGSSEAVVKTFGGELISFIKDGVEYVWQGDARYWDGQAPILFPVCCSPKNGVAAFNGVEYPMPKHGFACRRDFEPVFLSRECVILEQRENEETLRMFPFCYSLKAQYTINENGFSVRFTVKNLDRNAMSFCLGGHPGFNCPIFDDGSGFEDYSLIFDNAEGCTVSITNKGFMDASVPKVQRLNGTNVLPLRYPDFDNDAMIVENLPVKALKLVSDKTGHGVRFTFEGFDALGIWTPDHNPSPFVCLEPWNGLPADVAETTEMKDKKYAKTIAPDEEYSVGYDVEII